MGLSTPSKFLLEIMTIGTSLFLSVFLKKCPQEYAEHSFPLAKDKV